MSETTRRSLIDAVRRAEPDALQVFVERYLPIVRAHLQARWARSPLREEVADATHEVIARCLGPQGALSRLEYGHPSGLRGFLYGVTRNVALEHERRRAEPRGELGLEGFDGGHDETPSREFSRAYARAVMQEVRARFEEWSRQNGPEFLRRQELLVLRLEDGVPLREIALRWKVDAARLHHEYARARRDYRAVLLEVVAEQHPGLGAAGVHEAAQELLEHLG